MESGSTPPDSTQPSNRIPRAVIVIVAIGVIACIAAPLLTVDKGEGEAAHLEWVQHQPIPNSKSVLVPGSKKYKMQLINGGLRATGTNVAGYALFRALATLKIEKGAPVSKGRVVCSVHAPAPGTEIAQSSGGLRATYPRSSEEGIYGQEVSETVTMQFSSHSYELAVVESTDLPPRWTTIQGVKLGWPKYQPGTEHLRYYLPNGKPKVDIELPFYTIWKSQRPPAAKIACELEVAAGKATVHTEGAMKEVSPPINEEKEAEKQEKEAAAEEPSAAGEEPAPTGR